MLKAVSSFSRFVTKIPIQPLGSRVVVELDKAKEKVGSLYVPEAAKQQTNEGTILAVGPGNVIDGKKIEVTVKVGQRVLLPTFGGQKVKIEKNEYTIVDEESILGVFQ